MSYTSVRGQRNRQETKIFERKEERKEEKTGDRRQERREDRRMGEEGGITFFRAEMACARSALALSLF